MHVIASPHFKGRTSGLCGTFNGNQQDDFRTPEGGHEADAITFANSWKLDATCKAGVKKEHACDIQVSKRNKIFYG